MVLHGSPCGRVGRRRSFSWGPQLNGWGPFLFPEPMRLFAIERLSACAAGSRFAFRGYGVMDAFAAAWLAGVSLATVVHDF